MYEYEAGILKPVKHFLQKGEDEERGVNLLRIHSTHLLNCHMKPPCTTIESLKK
jgi:hypothetical protein